MRVKLHCENRQKALQRSWTIFNDKRDAVKAVVGRGWEAAEGISPRSI